ncbi:MAG: OmpA family protein [Pseudomonadota bacterium]
MIWRGACLAALACGPALAQSLEVALPVTARQVVEESVPATTVRVPFTVWQAGEVQSIRAEGDVRRRVWQIGSPGMTTEQILAPLRDALTEAGYALLLSCEARGCGGFEFRFATDTLPPPEMFVDLGDYRFLAAQTATEEGTAWVTIMVSRSDALGFVQITDVRPGAATAPRAGLGAVARALGEGDLGAELEAAGRAVLSGLSFETGSAALGDGRFDALEDLATYLDARPEQRIVLVGHTDAQGALSGNIELSRRRAASVRARLIDAYGIDGARIRSEGVGYLAPLVPNATPEGRERNRRVEVILDGPL